MRSVWGGHLEWMGRNARFWGEHWKAACRRGLSLLARAALSRPEGPCS